MSFKTEIPDLLVFMHRIGPLYAWQQANVAKLTQESYQLISVYDPTVTAHRAANIALERSSSRFVAIMDDDCVPLLPKWLGKLVDVLKRHDDVACVTPLEVKTPELVRQTIKDPNSIIANDPWRTLEMSWTATYLTLLDREKIPDIMLDDNMPGSVAMADVDLCFQIRSAGYKVAYTNDTIVYHPIKSMDPRWRDKWKAVPKEEIDPMVEKQKQYMFQKWGLFYAQNMGMGSLSVIERRK